MSKDRPNLAVVGVGSWGKNLLREFSNLETQNLCQVKICVATGSANSREHVVQSYPDLEYTTNYERILTDPTIDAVVLATPSHTHFSLASQAIEAGKDVFVEKPPTETVTQAEQLRDLAQLNKRALFTDNIFLHHPLILKLKTLIDSEQVEGAWFDFSKWGSFEGDIFADLAYHDIYLALKLFGPTNNVELVETVGFATSADRVRFNLTHQSRMVSSISVNRYSSTRLRSVIVKAGQTYVWTNERLAVVTQGGKKLETLEESAVPPLPLVCKAFLEQIKSGTKSYESIDMVIQTIDIINKLQDSAPRKT